MASVFFASSFVGCVAIATAAHAQGAANQLRATEEIRIRGADHDISAFYGSTMLVFPDGTIAHFDETNARFVFFDHTGKQTAMFGRRGAGPGEFAGQAGGTFRSPTGVSRPAPTNYQLTVGLMGDTAWVYDRTQRRFTVFTRDAKVARTTAAPTLDPKVAFSFTPLGFASDGRVLGEMVTGINVSFTEPDGDKGTFWRQTDSAFVVVSSSGSVERRIASLPPNNASVVVASRGAYSSSSVPFAIGPLRDVSVSGDRVLIVTHQVTSATGGTSQVTVIGARGDTIVAKTYPFTSAAIPKARTDSAYSAKEKSLTSSGSRDPTVTAELLRGIRSKMPHTEAPFTAAMLGRDGTIWLALRSDKTVLSHLVLDDRGNALGTVSIPRDPYTSIREVSRDALWVVTRDADGFSDVIRYKLSR